MTQYAIGGGNLVKELADNTNKVKKKKENQNPKINS